MKTKHNIRVLWLLNHTTLRKFELDQMINLGITEFFLPKFYPYDEGNLSASIDYSFDAQLTIPASSLAVLNDQNWYKEPSAQAWDIANQYFDIAVIGFVPDQINSTARYFDGQIVLRAFGLVKGNNYTTFLYDSIGVHGVDRLRKIKTRIWFGSGYENLHECEGSLLQERNCYLPVGFHTVKHEQKRLLKKMSPDYCGFYFTKTYDKIIDNISDDKIKINSIVQKKKRIAVILPSTYRGGSLRGAICLANSLLNGANLGGETIEVVFAHLALPQYENDNLFLELESSVKRRSFLWKTLSRDEATRALCYAGHADWSAKHQEYDIPDDGINQFLDCDLWIIVSDQLNKSILPLRPYVLMIYDYIQRYISSLSHEYENMLLQYAREASRVLVTTEFTKNDALQYAGVQANRVFKVPMLVPALDQKLVCFSEQSQEQKRESFVRSQNNKDHSVISSAEKMLRPYFMWITNVAKHKNHINVYLALQKYYYEFDGLLECHILGAGTDKLTEFYPQLGAIYNSSDKLQEQLTFCGELTDASYINKLRGASFLFHAALIDNGTFCVIEAAKLGVPSLSNNYPPMREINERFNLGLSWMDATNPNDIALQLKKMEETYIILKDELMKKDPNQFQHTLDEEAHYWRVICECL